jgi:hypothetical protein
VPRDVLAQRNAENGNVEADRDVGDAESSASPAQRDRRFRLPVCVALGRVVSMLLVVICSPIHLRGRTEPLSVFRIA